MQEREAKLIADDDLQLPDLSGVHPGATLGEAKRRDHVDRYFDSEDLRLARWGCTLRHRSSEGWTLKLPVAASASVLRRDEIDVEAHDAGPSAAAGPNATDAGPGDPPAQALALVAPLLRGAPVALVATLRTERQVRSLQGEDGGVLIELSDDRVVAELADGSTVAFREIEAEVDRATTKDLRRAIKALEAAGARAEPATPKLVRALGERATAPADVTASALPRHPSARQVLTESFVRSTRRLLLELPHAAVGVDPEGVHQARVATRRLRSDLRSFRPLFEPAWSDHLRGELGWLADELGAVRDADVLSARVVELTEQHPEISAVDAAPVLAALRRRRDDRHRQLVAHLADERARLLYDQLVEACRALPLDETAEGPAQDTIAALTRATVARVRKAVARLDGVGTAEDRHRVRIVAKRARYAIDTAAPTFGPKAAGLSGALGELQDVLGDANDRAVAQQWLAETAAELPPSAAFTAGRLAQALAPLHSDGTAWRAPYDRVMELSGKAWFARR